MSNPEKQTPGTGNNTGGDGKHGHLSPETSASTIAPADDGPNQKGLRYDTTVAIQFLQAWAPKGPWVLTSIPIEGGGTQTRTFDATQLDAMVGWVDDRQGKQNIYFTVNRTHGPVSKKPSKPDMVGAVALHVDVDPRPGEELASERERALRVLREYSPPPSVIVDSGGGYQGFWLLKQTFELTGDPEDELRHLPVEDRNRHIELQLQADNCHNIDRIMRLPGTVNIPNEKKRKKGRVAAPANVVEADWSRIYELTDFTSAPVDSNKISTGSANQSSFTAADDVDVAALNLPDRVKALIVNGADPDEPEKWTDRSALVMHVLCEMIRADLSDAVMKAVILDPDLAVSAHILDQNNADRYAERQVLRALERQSRPGPVLHGGPIDHARALQGAKYSHLKHFQQEFLDWDGAAYIGVADDTVRAQAWRFLDTCRVHGKDNDLRPFVPTTGAVSAAVDALRAVVHLSPSRDEPPRWLDGRTGPNPLDLLPTRSGLLHLPTGDLLPATPELFTRNSLDFAYMPDAPKPLRWLAFLSEVWPGENEADCITALQEFMGYLLTPDTSLQKALLIPGPKRSGKGTIGRIMGKLVGDANTVAPSLNSFGRSDFGLEPLLAKQLATISDARISNRTDEAAIAENLLRITGEDRVSVNRKHRQALEVTLRVRFVVMTNEVPKFADRSGALASRFIVLPMRQSFIGREDTGLTAALMAELPGILNWAVDGWRRVRANGRIAQPMTGADVAEQMTDLGSPIHAFLRECCTVGGDGSVEKGRMFDTFRNWHRQRIGHDYSAGANVFARDLYTAEPSIRSARPRVSGGRVLVFDGVDLLPGVGSVGDDREPPF